MDTIHVNVHLDWLAPDPEAGERLALVFLNGDPKDVQRARQALETALGRDGTWDEFGEVCRINLDGLVTLRALARRWESLHSALAELEARDPVFEHYRRDLRWRKLRFARWEQEEKARQERARQARREEREERERERAQRQDFAQRAWQTRGVSGLPPDVAAAFSELALLPSAPPDLVDLAFRHFARRAHPDLADQNDEAERLRRTERMKQLSHSRETLVAYFARQAARQRA